MEHAMRDMQTANHLTDVLFGRTIDMWHKQQQNSMEWINSADGE